MTKRHSRSGTRRSASPQKTFSVSADFLNEKTLLHFGAVDQIAKVFINGNLIGTHEGGYEPFYFDITDLLADKNTVRDIAKDDLNTHLLPYGKQKHKRGGMWYTPVSGIWQTVWLEGRPAIHVEDIKITPYEKGVKITVTGGDIHKKITLKESGEVKFRQCFELLHPLFLHRLREKVPSITRREELLSMLIVLKQNNKEIAELLAIAPRSVLMLRHRFRQKIGMNTEYSLEYFIEELLGVAHSAETTPEESSNSNE